MASSEEQWMVKQRKKKRKGSSSLHQVSLLDQWKTSFEKENHSLTSSAVPQQQHQQQRLSSSLKPAPPKKASHAAAAASFFLPRKNKTTKAPPVHHCAVARAKTSQTTTTTILPQQQPTLQRLFHAKKSKTTAAAPIIDLTAADDDDDENDNDSDNHNNNNNSSNWMNNQHRNHQNQQQHDVLFTTDEFHAMWHATEVDHGLATLDIEHSKLIRAANTKVAASDSRQQARAQYGRLLSQGFAVLSSAAVLDLTNKNRNNNDDADDDDDDLFIDIGHGIGSLVLQAAYTIGCNARGIEIDGDRNVVAGIYKHNLDHQRSSFPQYQTLDYQSRTVGSVHFEHGELSDPKHWLFLSGGVKQQRRGPPPLNPATCSLDDYIAFPKHRVKVWVNNYNGVFSEKSAKKTGNKISMYYLDHFIGGLLALMKPGSIMVTLHKLPLGPSLQDVNRHLQHRHLPYRPDASFFSLERVDLGAANEIVSWSEGGGCTDTITAYKYTRVDQQQHHQGGTNNGNNNGNNSNKAVFYCFNPDCEEYNVPQDVLQQVEQCGPKLVARTSCRAANCACNIRESRRRNNKKQQRQQEQAAAATTTTTMQPTQEH